MKIEIGKFFLNYKVVNLIGGGGFGEVYKGEKDNPSKGDEDKVVAIKVLHEVHSHDEKLVRRFHREAKLAKKLSHPNVVKIFSDGIINGLHYINERTLRSAEEKSKTNTDYDKKTIALNEKDTLKSLTDNEDNDTVTLYPNEQPETLTKKTEFNFENIMDIAVTVLRQCATVLQEASSLKIS